MTNSLCCWRSAGEALILSKDWRTTKIIDVLTPWNNEPRANLTSMMTVRPAKTFLINWKVFPRTKSRFPSNSIPLAKLRTRLVVRTLTNYCKFPIKCRLLVPHRWRQAIWQTWWTIHTCINRWSSEFKEKYYTMSIYVLLNRTTRPLIWRKPMRQSSVHSRSWMAWAGAARISIRTRVVLFRNLKIATQTPRRSMQL